MCSQYVVNGNAGEISKANTMMQAALAWWSVCLDLIMGNTQTAGRGIRYEVVVW